MVKIYEINEKLGFDRTLLWLKEFKLLKMIWCFTSTAEVDTYSLHSTLPLTIPVTTFFTSDAVAHNFYSRVSIFLGL